MILINILEASMTNSELVKHLSERLGKPQVELKRILGEATRIMKEVMDKDTGITIPGLGIFHTVLKKKRKSFNPHHNSFMMLPPKRVVKFRASTPLKESVKDRRF
jgi:nucleoid DNA-binding protein